MKVYDLSTVNPELVRAGLLGVLTGKHKRELTLSLFAGFVDGPIAINTNLTVNVFEDVDKLLTAERIKALMTEQKVRVTVRKFTEKSTHANWHCTSAEARQAIIDCMLTGGDHVRQLIEKMRGNATDAMLGLD